jgi:hypothetical protein
MQQGKKVVCPDCGDAVQAEGLNRRDFLRSMTAAAAAAATAGTGLWAVPKATAAPTPKGAAESAVKALYDTLTDKQRQEICFDWDYQDKERGLLRTRISANWHITKPSIASEYYTKEQQELCRKVYESLLNPDWVKLIDKQLRDDGGGRVWGDAQNIAIFGKPGAGKSMLVMTGRHLTIRADGNNEDHMAFGGPIFHGHAASGGTEMVHHPGNVFWHQAVEANKVYMILSGKQQQQALVARRPAESAVSFRGPDGKYPGIPVSELSRDQKEGVQKVLMSLIAPYRKEDHEEVLACIQKQGGLDKCSLAFYKDGDMGDDGEWDNWRLEGPSFVWYFRGQPHVHIWINVGDNPSVKLNA